MDKHIFETLQPQGFQKSNLFYKALDFVTIGHFKLKSLDEFKASGVAPLGQAPILEVKLLIC